MSRYYQMDLKKHTKSNQVIQFDNVCTVKAWKKLVI
jgi:hypothetical protein